MYSLRRATKNVQLVEWSGSDENVTVTVKIDRTLIELHSISFFEAVLKKGAVEHQSDSFFNCGITF